MDVNVLLSVLVDVNFLLLVIDNLFSLVIQSPHTLGRSPNNRVCHCLFHQVHFTLSNKFHVGVSEWDQ